MDLNVKVMVQRSLCIAGGEASHGRADRSRRLQPSGAQLRSAGDRGAEWRDVLRRRFAKSPQQEKEAAKDTRSVGRRVGVKSTQTLQDVQRY